MLKLPQIELATPFFSKFLDVDACVVLVNALADGKALGFIESNVLFKLLLAVRLRGY